ncbi:MAG: hypothetical protein JNK21_13305, partial [Rhodospirillaceae bacterium]|nr:hypothetical protein [Rhodospirillaceae bacterium]
MVFRHFSALAAGAARSRLAALLATTALSLPTAALAGPVTVNSSTTQPLKTSTGDGQGPGNITIENAGSITVTTGVPLTVDSSNDVIMNGTLRHDGQTNATGFLISTDNAAGAGHTITSTIAMGGLINVPSSNTTSVSNNFGLRFAGNGTLQGSFTSTSASQIAVGGREAVAIS